MLLQHTCDCGNLKKAFREIGGVDDNEISRAEFAEFVTECVPKFPGGVIAPTEDVVAAAFAHVDKDGSGLIDFREFEQWLGMAVEEAYKRVRGVITAACDMDTMEKFWTDRAQWESDAITVEELKRFVVKCVEAVPESEGKVDPGDVEMTFNYINTQEHDGVLDRDEFDYFFFVREK